MMTCTIQWDTGNEDVSDLQIIEIKTKDNGQVCIGIIIYNWQDKGFNSFEIMTQYEGYFSCSW